MSGYNPSRSTWVNPNIEYLFNSEIIEYDMKEAGYNILQHYQLVAPEEIKRLSKMEKEERHRAIGLLQRGNKELSKALSDRFAEIRHLFISANGLDENRIISVKKDAIYTIDSCEKLKFGKIEFLPKKRYTSYIRFTDNMNIEIYYYDGEMDIKGIGESGLNRHRLYLLTFLQKVIFYLEGRQGPALSRYLKRFIDEYKGGTLDEAYYVEFNNMSRTIDASYNYHRLLLPLIQISLKEMS